jgi:hypothetical protein
MLLDGGFLGPVEDVLLARTRAHRAALAEAKGKSQGDGDGIGRLTWKEKQRMREVMEGRSSNNGGGETEGGASSSSSSSSFDALIDSVRPCQVVLSAATLPNYGLKVTVL